MTSRCVVSGTDRRSTTDRRAASRAPNPAAASERSPIADGQLVDIVSEWADGERRSRGYRVVEYPTAKGCAATYFPEANELVPLGYTAKESNTPVSKSIIVRLEPTT